MRLMLRFFRCLLLAALCTALPARAVSFAGVGFCGGTVVPGDPTDMNNQLGDMTLQAAVDQPAGITTCGKGYLLAKCGDHESANKIFDKCIAAGYVGAMIWKALQFENGNGVERSLEAAADLLRRAAMSEDPAYGPIGRLHYATVLHQGRGVPKDTDEAMRWFRRAADEGNEEARDFLRTGYHTGARDGRGMGAGVPDAAALAPLQQTTGIMSGPQAPADDAGRTAATPAALAMALTATGSPDAAMVPPPALPAVAPVEPPERIELGSVSGVRLEAVAPDEPMASPGHFGAAAWLLLAAFLFGAAFGRPATALRVRLPALRAAPLPA